MAETFIIAQEAPLAATNTPIYTVPAATKTLLSSLTVCNRSGTATTFRVAIRGGGVALADKHYTHYDVAIPGNYVYEEVAGRTLTAGTIVVVYATLATVSFTLHGVEIT